MSTSEKTKKGKEKGEGNGGKKVKSSSGLGASGKNNSDGTSTKKGEKFRVIVCAIYQLISFFISLKTVK